VLWEESGIHSPLKGKLLPNRPMIAFMNTSSFGKNYKVGKENRAAKFPLLVLFSKFFVNLLLKPKGSGPLYLKI
jgi:hypothetical protein